VGWLVEPEVEGSSEEEVGKANVNGLATGAVDEEATAVVDRVGKSNVKGEAREVEGEAEVEEDVEGPGDGGKVKENGVPELVEPEVDGGEAGGEGASAAATVSIELLPLVPTSSGIGRTRLTGELRKRMRWGVHGGGASIKLWVRFVLSFNIFGRMK